MVERLPRDRNARTSKHSNHYMRDFEQANPHCSIQRELSLQSDLLTILILYFHSGNEMAVIKT